jgi:hypothetical protein
VILVPGDPDRREEFHRRHLDLIAGARDQVAMAKAAIRDSKTLIRQSLADRPNFEVSRLIAPDYAVGRRRAQRADEHGQAASLGDESARLAERMAEVADTFASLLEEAAARGDRARRLQLAASERRIADVERRNAARLRNHNNGHAPLMLEALPSLLRQGDRSSP